MKIIAKWFVSALAILLAAYLVPGIAVASFYTALIVAALLGVANLVLKPILVILTLPISIITLGLFTIVINGFLFWFVGTIVKGFSVSGFMAALLGALVVSMANYLGDKIISD